jgi:DNA uptake protein ComE-like DNA-binding protein
VSPQDEPGTWVPDELRESGEAKPSAAPRPRHEEARQAGPQTSEWLAVPAEKAPPDRESPRADAMPQADTAKHAEAGGGLAGRLARLRLRRERGREAPEPVGEGEPIPPAWREPAAASKPSPPVEVASRPEPPAPSRAAAPERTAVSQAEPDELRGRLAQLESEREAAEHHRAELQALTETVAEAAESHARAQEAIRAEAETARREAEERHRAERDQLAAALEATKAEKQELEARLAEAERALAGQREATKQATEQAARDAAAYDERIAEMQRQLERFEQAARQATERLAASTTGGRSDETGRLELNTVTVEGLRGLGLSITQAARIVTRRDATGGFGSLDELDEVPGIPSEQRAALRERLYIDPSLAAKGQ